MKILSPPARDEIWQLLDSSGIGGIESQTVRLARALNARGIPSRVILLGDYGPHPMEPALIDAGVECIKLKDGPLGLIRLLRSTAPRLVHTRGYKGGIYGRILCRLFGVPVVSHFHAGEPGEGKLRLYNKLDAMTSVLAPGMAVSKPIADRMVRTPVIINNMVDIPPSPVPGDGNVIAFVGRLSHEKGPDWFLDLATRFPDQSFEVFGDGPLKDQTIKSAPDNVAFHGMVTNLEQHWPRIGLLCMPSRHEGLPNAALEAMAHAVPVAAFAVGDLPRLLGGGAGWLADTGNMDAMAKLLADWVDMPAEDRRHVGMTGRERVTQHHGPEAVLPTIFNVYGRALGNRNDLASRLQQVA